MQNVGSSNPQRNIDNPSDFRYGEAGGRLRLVDGLKLEYATFTSSIINVNDVNVAVGAPNNETLLCNSSDETIDLNGAERKMFDKSVSAVAGLCEACIGIAPNLGKK